MAETKETQAAKRKREGKCISCGNVNDTPEFSTCSKCRARNREWWNANYRWYAEHHICVRCHQHDAVKGKKMCHVCASYLNNWQNTKHKPLTEEQKKQHNGKIRQTYADRKAKGLCVKCGRPRLHSRSTIMCNECYQKHRRKKYEAYHAKIEIERKNRPDHGLCMTCGKPYEPNGYKICDECRERSRQGALAEDKTKWLEWHRQENSKLFKRRGKKRNDLQGN